MTMSAKNFVCECQPHSEHEARFLYSYNMYLSPFTIILYRCQLSDIKRQVKEGRKKEKKNLQPQVTSFRVQLYPHLVGEVFHCLPFAAACDCQSAGNVYSFHHLPKLERPCQQVLKP